VLHSWPGTVANWPLFVDDERVFSQAVDALVRRVLDGPYKRFPAMRALNLTKIVKLVENKLRPELANGWMVISVSMKDAITVPSAQPQPLALTLTFSIRLSLSHNLYLMSEL
jgi:hypothetical protein